MSTSPERLTEILGEIRHLETKLEEATAVVATASALDKAVTDAKRVARRFAVPVVLVALLALVSLGTIVEQYRVLNEIRSCTTATGACYKRLASNPDQAKAITTLVNSIVDDLGCVLLIPPAQRSQATLDQCKAAQPVPRPK